MTTAPDELPDDVDVLKTALVEARAKLSGAEALIEHLQLVIGFPPAKSAFPNRFISPSLMRSLAL